MLLEAEGGEGGESDLFSSENDLFRNDTELGDLSTAAYPIAPTTYANKKGKTTALHLVTFDRELPIEDRSRMLYMDIDLGESYLPSERFSNFALHLAAIYKGETQKVTQKAFNDLYDIIQGTREPDLFGEVDNTPKSLAEAIKQVFNIDYKRNGKNNCGWHYHMKPFTYIRRPLPIKNV